MEMLMEKEDFIYRNRILLIIAINCILSVSLFSQPAITGGTDSLVAKIDFQKGFNNDTIDLKVNSNSVLKKSIATSHRLSDYTGMALEIVYFKVKEANVRYLKKTKRIPVPNNNIFLEIRLNRSYFTFNVDLSKGKFLGIYKTKENKLELVQSERRFVYD